MSSKRVRAAENTLRNLSRGAPSGLLSDLGPLESLNAKSLTDNGEAFTDTLAGWLNKGIVAGPFDSPQLHNFRVNRMIALKQRTKIRPVMDLSAPEGDSYNESLDLTKLRKVSMSS